MVLSLLPTMKKCDSVVCGQSESPFVCFETGLNHEHQRVCLKKSWCKSTSPGALRNVPPAEDILLSDNLMHSNYCIWPPVSKLQYDRLRLASDSDTIYCLTRCTAERTRRPAYCIKYGWWTSLKVIFCSEKLNHKNVRHSNSAIESRSRCVDIWITCQP